ncbi:GNAT family N-acetyltransferase [Natrialbaceae archaeon A-CW1-1]
MEIREATADDSEAIRSVAHHSLSESYTHFLDEEIIDEAVDNWYGDDLGDELEHDETVVLVAEDDGEIIGFSQSEWLDETQGIGRIQWIHVDPAHRGDGLGVRLLVRTRDALLDAGAEQLQGAVLAGNEFGNEFYVAHGFELSGSRDLEVGSETHTENVYIESEGELESSEAWRALEAIDAAGGTLYVSYGEPARGSKAPFYTVYEDADADERYGWFCGNCDATDVAMDSMGRVVCNECGNKRKATRWDASYL